MCPWEFPVFWANFCGSERNRTTPGIFPVPFEIQSLSVFSQDTSVNTWDKKRKET